MRERERARVKRDRGQRESDEDNIFQDLGTIDCGAPREFTISRCKHVLLPAETRILGWGEVSSLPVSQLSRSLIHSGAKSGETQKDN